MQMDRISGNTLYRLSSDNYATHIQHGEKYTYDRVQVRMVHLHNGRILPCATFAFGRGVSPDTSLKTLHFKNFPELPKKRRKKRYFLSVGDPKVSAGAVRRTLIAEENRQLPSHRTRGSVFGQLAAHQSKVRRLQPHQSLLQNQ